MNILYGLKVGQSQDYDAAGKRWPVTSIFVEPMTAISSRQVAFGTKKHPNKALLGLLKNLTEKLTPKYIRELDSNELTVGNKTTVAEVFAVGDIVKVTGTNKGKGFQGVVRRHGFAGGPKTHGQSDRQRHPGSIGQTTTPGRVYKGKKMAGHMGNVQVSVTNLPIFAIKPEENMLIVRGLVPGVKGGLLKITKQSKRSAKV